ncbi:MAG: L-histidine N(alpha)-methyltransferase [Bryobacterales bacterium]|nr:L-histidine N(alpha)-methyltransferase [Bryobacterales bacterium]
MPLPGSVAFPATCEAAPEGAPALAGGDAATRGRGVIESLTRPGLREIPSTWLYDELGSVLFEAITLLPEYGLTRADERVIERAAPEIARLMGPSPLVVELGSGSGKKTAAILAASLELGPVDYTPIDVSASALEACREKLAEMPGLRVFPTEGSYLGGLARALAHRATGQPVLVLFLGSTIGNFSRRELPPFLRRIRGMLRERDRFLVGADLVKAAATLQRAYDDPAGVTAAFNKNLLAHLNAAFDGNFDLARFAHEAVYNEDERRIEMYLRSEERQTVHLQALDLHLTLERGERIRTELSHKFHSGELDALAHAAGFLPEREWIDAEWPFAECLWRAE